MTLNALFIAGRIEASVTCGYDHEGRASARFGVLFAESAQFENGGALSVEAHGRVAETLAERFRAGDRVVISGELGFDRRVDPRGTGFDIPLCAHIGSLMRLTNSVKLG